jgi:hypothetical protein
MRCIPFSVWYRIERSDDFTDMRVFNHSLFCYVTLPKDTPNLRWVQVSGRCEGAVAATEESRLLYQTLFVEFILSLLKGSE